eukprot:171268_1
MVSYLCAGLLLYSILPLTAIGFALRYDVFYDYYYDNSPCRDGTYLIDLALYLYVPSFISLFITILCIGPQIIIAQFGSDHAWIIVVGLSSLSHFVYYPLYLYDLVWACLGAYIYSDQMSNDCKHEDIAKMILAWIIIQFISVCCLGCSLIKTKQ